MYKNSKFYERTKNGRTEEQIFPLSQHPKENYSPEDVNEVGYDGERATEFTKKLIFTFFSSVRSQHKFIYLFDRI